MSVEYYKKQIIDLRARLEKEKEAETAEEKPVAGKKLRARKGAKAEEPAAEAPAAETPAEE